MATEASDGKGRIAETSVAPPSVLAGRARALDLDAPVRHPVIPRQPFRIVFEASPNEHWRADRFRLSIIRFRGIVPSHDHQMTFRGFLSNPSNQIHSLRSGQDQIL